MRLRATSLWYQADAVGQSTGGLAIGAVGSAFSIRAALVGSGLCMVPALALYGRAIRHQRDGSLDPVRGER